MTSRKAAVAPGNGDAIRARSLVTGRWMGGVVARYDFLEGWVEIVGGKYALYEEGVRCSLYGAEVVHVGPLYVEIYKDVGLVLQEEYRR